MALVGLNQQGFPQDVPQSSAEKALRRRQVMYASIDALKTYGQGTDAASRFACQQAEGNIVRIFHELEAEAR